MSDLRPGFNLTQLSSCATCASCCACWRLQPNDFLLKKVSWNMDPAHALPGNFLSSPTTRILSLLPGSRRSRSRTNQQPLGLTSFLSFPLMESSALPVSLPLHFTESSDSLTLTSNSSSSTPSQTVPHRGSFSSTSSVYWNQHRSFWVPLAGSTGKSRSRKIGRVSGFFLGRPLVAAMRAAVQPRRMQARRGGRRRPRGSGPRA
mmetsp:Transcript_123619/g.350069  ORF Transcript_123619/g.350069 Transcript_123619/m.350069 type:complete len:204 (+) Transcript_123619:1087-1698(+)